MYIIPQETIPLDHAAMALARNFPVRDVKFR
jgi:hypothetical protein